MFYVNVDTQLFCKSPEEPKRSGDKPWFRHLEGKTPIFPTSFLQRTIWRATIQCLRSFFRSSG